MGAIPFNSDYSWRDVPSAGHNELRGGKGLSATKNASDAGNPQSEIVASHWSGEGIGGQTVVDSWRRSRVERSNLSVLPGVPYITGCNATWLKPNEIAKHFPVTCFMEIEGTMGKY